VKAWERALVDRFVCPRCGAKNTPKVTIIHLGRSGDARCSHCGKEDAARGFLPEEQQP
jgi:transcription elongation factor Elf1